MSLSPSCSGPHSWKATAACSPLPSPHASTELVGGDRDGETEAPSDHHQRIRDRTGKEIPRKSWRGREEHCQPARWTCPSRSMVLSLPLFSMPIHNVTRSRGCPTSTPRAGFSPLHPNCDCVQAIIVLTTGSHTAPERASPPLPSRGRAIFVHKYEYAMALVSQVSVAASIPKIKSGPLACHAMP